ncbi:MAG: RluA family pseudouridine synthase [Lachnospiraceae bacterium]|nr:RluA family pseudouridine synthase [Lachnospiraceae bacterium]
MIRVFNVSEEYADERIDKYLSEQLDDISRSYIQKLIKSNNVKVFDEICKANYKLVSGDVIFIDIPAPVELDVMPENIPLDIVYEDNDFIIINKPKQMVVHPAAGHYNNTLVNALMYHCKDNLSGINGVLRPGIVHRIDMDTTGLLVVCKNDLSHIFISEQLKCHSVKRCYHAIVNGVLKEDEGTIVAPIGRDPNNRLKMTIVKNGGKDATTHYRVIERFKNHTYIECELKTGRTHQIRVHMSSIKHPLLGDTVYGSAKCPYKLTGQTLHAKTLGFIHPTTKEEVFFDSELPDYFKHLLNVLPK